MKGLPGLWLGGSQVRIVVDINKEVGLIGRDSCI